MVGLQSTSRRRSTFFALLSVELKDHCRALHQLLALKLSPCRLADVGKAAHCNGRNGREGGQDGCVARRAVGRGTRMSTGLFPVSALYSMAVLLGSFGIPASAKEGCVAPRAICRMDMALRIAFSASSYLAL